MSEWRGSKIRRRSWARLKIRATPWIFLIPTLIVIFAIDLYPFFTIWDIGLRSWSFGNPSQIGEPLGLENYFTMLHDPGFWDSVGVTVMILFTALPIEFGLGFLVAFILFYKVSDRVRKFIIVPIIVPMTVAPVVVGLNWKYIFQGDFGIFTYYANRLGFFTEYSILGSPTSALPTIIMVEIWHWTPFIILIVLAGLLALPREPFEAAVMDGATAWMKFKHITLPYLRPLIGIVVILRGMDLLKLFDEVYILTGGGPGTATESLMMYCYRANFVWWDLGFGAAVSLFLFLIIALFSLFFLYITLRRE